MKVFNEDNISKLARLNEVVRKLRNAGVAAAYWDFDRSGARLRLPSAPPAEVVPRSIHKVKGLNIAKLDGVTLLWEGQP